MARSMRLHRNTVDWSSRNSASHAAEATPQHEWYRAFFMRVESERGLAAQEDHLYTGLFRATLAPGQTLTIVASTEEAPDLDGAAAYTAQRAHEQQLISDSGHGAAPAWVQHLVLAADQFIVRRPLCS